MRTKRQHIRSIRGIIINYGLPVTATYSDRRKVGRRIKFRLSPFCSSQPRRSINNCIRRYINRYFEYEGIIACAEIGHTLPMNGWGTPYYYIAVFM